MNKAKYRHFIPHHLLVELEELDVLDGLDDVPLSEDPEVDGVVAVELGLVLLVVPPEVPADEVSGVVLLPEVPLDGVEELEVLVPDVSDPEVLVPEVDEP
ncbi:hypothetical protein [Noviherbaspirillum malthae]|jgi:hypothetical protein|uniref:hypothetical protein n=1 Tax=Noviherbaspirillum malthae TaxID=1260987 RepID=UPI00188F614C|nr:hypothetical protein [Noviherbaspirillum malthae]